MSAAVINTLAQQAGLNAGYRRVLSEKRTEWNAEDSAAAKRAFDHTKAMLTPYRVGHA